MLCINVIIREIKNRKLSPFFNFAIRNPQSFLFIIYSQVFLGFDRELGGDELVGLAGIKLPFRPAHPADVFNQHPFVPGEIGGGHDPVAGDQLLKILIRHLEGGRWRNRIQRDEHKELLTNTETEVVLPLDVLRDTVEPHADLP